MSDLVEGPHIENSSRKKRQHSFSVIAPGAAGQRATENDSRPLFPLNGPTAAISAGRARWLRGVRGRDSWLRCRSALLRRREAARSERLWVALAQQPRGHHFDPA